jgi:hypothetical protein
MTRASWAAGAAALMVLGANAPASATTLTFDRLADEFSAYFEPDGGTTYREKGFLAQTSGGVLAWDQIPGAAHIDDAGTGFTSDVTFTRKSGGIFDAISFNIISAGFGDPGNTPDETIRVTGTKANGKSVSKVFDLSEVFGTLQTLLLGTKFRELVSVTIAAVYRDPGETFCAPCSHFDLDSATFEVAGDVPSEVPLPAGAGLLAGALAGLALVRRRRGVSPTA